MGRPVELTAEQREKLLEKGFKPVEIWVPRSDDATYRAEAARQAREAAKADAEDNAMSWVASVSGGVWDD